MMHDPSRVDALEFEPFVPKKKPVPYIGGPEPSVIEIPLGGNLPSARDYIVGYMMGLGVPKKAP
jgi:hypothetical protein